MSIDKHHTMLYAAGRAIDVLDFGDGTRRHSCMGVAEAGSCPSRRINAVATYPTSWAIANCRRSRPSTSSPRRFPTPPPSSILADGSGFHGPLSMNQHASVRILGAHRDTNGDPS